MDLVKYRQSDSEISRTEDLLRLLPRGRTSVLDIGARDGHFSKLLAEHFDSVTALDMTPLNLEYPRLTVVTGDATNLPFPDDSFDCVFCAEVLEHIPNVVRAAQEIARVTRHEIIIGVPYRQDIRLWCVTCPRCGKVSPPYGHVNSFDDQRLTELFPGWDLVARSFVGLRKEATSAFATWLMDIGGNPWGTYDQHEPCSHCGAKLTPPAPRPIWRRACAAIALLTNRVRSWLSPSQPNWIHVVFSRPPR